MELREVARFAHAGEERVMLVGTDEKSLVVREELSGADTQVSYGEEKHVHYVVLTPESTVSLLGHELPLNANEVPFSEVIGADDKDLADVMDELDRRELKYAYVSLGENSGLQMRPPRL